MYYSFVSLVPNILINTVLVYLFIGYIYCTCYFQWRDMLCIYFFLCGSRLISNRRIVFHFIYFYWYLFDFVHVDLYTPTSSALCSVFPWEWHTLYHTISMYLHIVSSCKIHITYIRILITMILIRAGWRQRWELIGKLCQVFCGALLHNWPYLRDICYKESMAFIGLYSNKMFFPMFVKTHTLYSLHD